MKLRTGLLICVILTLVLCLGTLAADKISAGSDAVYFVSNGTGADTNAGTSAAAPLKTLGAAVSKLKSTGGTIVVCAPVNVTNWTPAAINGTTIVTSTYGGVDYAKTAGAYIYMTGTSSTITANSPLYFENITFDLRTKDTRFAANCHDFGFLSGVNMVKNCDDSAFAYPWIIGGFNASSAMTAATFDNDYTLTVESGHFGVLFLGNRRTSGAQAISDLSGDIGLNISGGTFDSTVYCSGMNVHSGRLVANISGGTFNGIVHGFCRLGTFPAADKMTATAYTAPLYLNITGGNFVKRFRLAESTLETNGAVRPILSDATVRITGGSFGADVCGYGVVGETLLKYDPNVLSADVIKGFPNKTTVTTAATAQRVSATFTNPIRGGGADPYIIEKDGVYYYCISSSTTVDGTAYAAVKVCAHGSIAFGELSTQRRTVVSASNTTIENAQHEFWAPELHYFTAAEVGDAAGWYIYVAADNGENKNHRMYVWRATEPENPLSEYEFAGQITSSDNHWAIDGTVLHLGGKIYFVWSGWVGDTNVDQRIYIAQMSSPTTISSARTELSVPTYSWERHGNPYVNEGPQILQKGNTTHIIYSASGSWTQYYCYGILTYTGTNPLSASSWTKQDSTIFSSSSANSVYGPGHGTFTTAPDGSWWMIYHANLSTTVPDGSTWWAQRKVFAKPFSWTTKTINGKTYDWPSLGSPTSAAQTINVTATDYHTEHVYGATYTRTSGAVKTLYEACLICGAENIASVTFTQTPTLTVSATAAGKLNLSITALSGVSGYKIYRKAPGESSYTLLKTQSGTTYTDTSLAAYSTYSYKVCAYTVQGGKTYTSAQSAAVSARTLCVHSYDSGAVTTAATCTADGVKTFTCTICGATKTESITKLGHNLSKTAAKAATCTTAGNKEYYTCSVCKKVYTTSAATSETTVSAQTIAKLGHNFATEYTVDVAATCTTAGSKSQHCSRCSATQNVTEIPATGHNLSKTAAKAATCTTAGNKEYYTCSVCKKVYTTSAATSETTVSAQTIAKLGHNFASSYTTDVAATCTTAGSKSQHCSRCSATQNVTEIPATGHNLSKTAAKAATCTTAGNKEYYTCSVCKKVYTTSAATSETTVSAQTIAKLGHNFATAYTTDVAATCTTAGSKSQHCSRCSATQNVTEIPATGHNLSKTAAKAATCTTAGNKEYYTCSVCKKVYTTSAATSETTVSAQTIAKLGHNFATEYTVDVAATCTTAGSKSQHCSRCSATQNVTEIPATGHNLSKTAAKAATCTTAGNKEYYTCSVCKKVYTTSAATSETTVSAQTIAKLGHNFATAYTTDVAATCTTAGSKSQHCSRCSATQNVTEIPATGHTYDDGVVTKEPTLTETGVCTYTCTGCGVTKTETLPTVTAVPTETTAGDTFEAVSARTGDDDFVLWTVGTTGSAELDVPVEIDAPEDFTVTFVYAMVGEFILPVDFIEEDGKIGFTASKDVAYVFCEAPLLTYGDATGDGELTINDILRTLRALTEEHIVIDKAAADISHSASLGLDDALLILYTILN